MNEKQVIALLRKESDHKNRGTAKWAREHGITASYVLQVLSGKSKPGKAVLDALGIWRRVIYSRAAANRVGQPPPAHKGR
jgi:hypothetical protein